MSILFDFSVPVYIQGLQQLLHLLEVGEKWADDNNIPHEKLLEARLANDMEVK